MEEVAGFVLTLAGLDHTADNWERTVTHPMPSVMCAFVPSWSGRKQ